jgi:hypothetical protein
VYSGGLAFDSIIFTNTTEKIFVGFVKQLLHIQERKWFLLPYELKLLFHNPKLLSGSMAIQNL